MLRWVYYKKIKSVKKINKNRGSKLTFFSKRSSKTSITKLQYKLFNTKYNLIIISIFPLQTISSSQRINMCFVLLQTIEIARQDNKVEVEIGFYGFAYTDNKSQLLE